MFGFPEALQAGSFPGDLSGLPLPYCNICIVYRYVYNMHVCMYVFALYIYIYVYMIFCTHTCLRMERQSSTEASLKHSQLMEILYIMVSAYVIYAVAEKLHSSGIIATLFGSMLMGIYATLA